MCYNSQNENCYSFIGTVTSDDFAAIRKYSDFCSERHREDNLRLNDQQTLWMVYVKRDVFVPTTMFHLSASNFCGRRQGWKSMCSVVCFLAFASLIWIWCTASAKSWAVHVNQGDRTVHTLGDNHPKRIKGAIVFLAPQRHEGSMWGIDRFCMLLRAVRSVDMYFNSRFGPYPIYVLVAKDYALDPRKKDGVYSDADRSLIRRWAPNSSVVFLEINMYSGDALEPGTNRDQILKWRQGKNGAIPGRDLGYTSMCRLWSGRLQSMSFLDQYTFYLRMDDDSLLTQHLTLDPFQQMERNELIYAYRRQALDDWGIQQLWQITKPHLDTNRTDLPFVEYISGKIHYSGFQPYNNFHVSRIDFWRSHAWQNVWKEYNNHHLFFKYRVGDANVHAMALMMMDRAKYDIWPELPYVHNSNDYGSGWGTKSWGGECQKDYAQFLNTP